MYCEKCKQKYDGNFCPECGSKLIPEPVSAGANAVDMSNAAVMGNVNMSDSHNVLNEDHSVHNNNSVSNVSNSNTVNNVTHNVTQVFVMMKPEDALNATAIPASAIPVNATPANNEQTANAEEEEQEGVTYEELVAMADNGTASPEVYYQLFVAHAFQPEQFPDEHKAFRFACKLLENCPDPDRNRLTALLAVAKCYKEGWGLPEPDIERAFDYAKAALDLLEQLENPEDPLDWEQELLNELIELSSQVEEEEGEEVTNDEEDTIEETEEPQQEDTPEAVVEELIENLVEGFEHVNVFSKNDKYKVEKYLITQREWEIMMGHNPSWEQGPDLPVTNITYHEAVVFVEKVNLIAARKGVKFEIPIRDWQWLGYQKEFAKAFSSGKDDPSAYCWHAGNSDGHLHPVGQKKPSAGIYDACGLVYEWCQTKSSNWLFWGAFNEPYKNVCTDKSSDTFYVDKRYDNLGLRLISKVD